MSASTVSAVLVATDATFATQTASGAVLVDVWATRCAPCRLLAPIVEKVAVGLDGRARVYSVDADENPLTVEQLGVRGIPALVLLLDGTVVDSLNGVTSRATIEAMIDRHLPAAQIAAAAPTTATSPSTPTPPTTGKDLR
ncbi:thioredoxin family protein [Herbiconiux daphne]|uniref:Thioredoxin family protein n=1 Tax=Herbiconiux daphne TaxID=2970914 RepID=A0ABT2H8Z2_9MICO|nr:thioredoxin family protein [Herbiconiux daphne]MCS5736358.1 thioredoxin family protein [Herbiconiux daphne]